MTGSSRGTRFGKELGALNVVQRYPDRLKMWAGVFSLAFGGSNTRDLSSTIFSELVFVAE